jgi:enoyl-CoA hydratase
MSSDAERFVEYVPNEGVVWIYLNRPDKRNAINQETAEQLKGALARFSNDAEARVAVLAGRGAGFCAGGDVAMFPSLADPAVASEFITETGESIQALFRDSRKPILGALHGYVIAGGFELALACHFTYASAETTFGMQEVRLGLLPGWGGTVRLAQRAGSARALELLLTADRIDADQARAFGVVNRVLPSRDDCFESIHQVARTIASMPPEAVERLIDVVKVATADPDSAHQVEQAAAVHLFQTDAAQQAIEATIRGGVGRVGKTPGH